MSNEPVRQHWVPKAYLRAFCTAPVERERIHVFDLAEGRSFPGATSLDNIAVVKHFYTLGKGTKDQSYEIETRLAQLESDTAPLLRELQATRKIFDEFHKRHTFSRFVATLLMRSRHGLQMIHAHREEVRERSVNSHGVEPPSYARELLEFNGEKMRELFAKSVIAMAEPLAKHICGMKWRLLEAEDGYFITSENPLLLYHPDETQWGLGTPGTMIQLPISPTLLVWFSAPSNLPELDPFPLPKDGVTGLNGLIVQGAEQYLFSHNNFDSLTDLLSGRPPKTSPEFGPASRSGKPDEA